MMELQELFNGGGRTIAAPDPDDLGRMAEEETPLMEICIFADKGETLSSGVVPTASSVASPRPTSRTCCVSGYIS